MIRTTMRRLFYILSVIAILICLCSCSLFYTQGITTTPSSPPAEEQPLFTDPAQSGNAENPGTDEALSFLKRIDKARGKNPDTVGWLYIPGTDIDNSVLQSFDNSYYISRDENRNDSVYSCYFVDCDNPLGAVSDFSPNTIIYGHSNLKDTPDGKRFSQLFKFVEPEFAVNTPNIYFSTEEGDYVWRVFSVFYTDISFNYIQTHPEDTEFNRIVERARAGSLYNYNVDVAAGDKLLTLSTCSVKYGNTGDNRFVVMARLLRADEKAEVFPKAPEMNKEAKPV